MHVSRRHKQHRLPAAATMFTLPAHARWSTHRQERNSLWATQWQASAAAAAFNSLIFGAIIYQNRTRIGPMLAVSGRFWSCSDTLWHVMMLVFTLNRDASVNFVSARYFCISDAIFIRIKRRLLICTRLMKLNYPVQFKGWLTYHKMFTHMYLV